MLNQNTSQVEELVSNGYIVIACNHTYNASVIFDKDGNAIIPYKQNIAGTNKRNTTKNIIQTY